MCEETGIRDLILSAPRANFLISIPIRTFTHTNVTSQTIIYLTLTQTKKISNLEPEVLTIFWIIWLPQIKGGWWI